MITRVWGLINMNQTLPFYNKGERWFFSLPDKDGVYICEFWAEDDYGNIGYNRAILYVQKGVVKCLRVISTRYRATLLKLSPTLENTSRSFEISGRVSEHPAHLNDSRYVVAMKTVSCPYDMREVS